MKDILFRVEYGFGKLFAAALCVAGLEFGIFAPNLFASSCVAPPDGMVANWRGEGNANDSFGGNNGILVNGATFAPGMVGQGFSLDGINSYVLIPNSAALSLTNEITIEFWYKDTGSSAATHGLISKSLTTGAQLVNYGVAEDLGPQNIITSYFNEPSTWYEFSQHSPPPVAGLFHHLAVTFRQLSDGSNVEIDNYVDGQMEFSSVLKGNLARTANSAPVVIGAWDPTQAYFKGIMDEVSIYRRALTATEIQAIYLAGSAGKCVGPCAPYVYVPPNPTVAIVGASATLSAAVGGTMPIQYQWMLNGTNIPGATTYSLTIPNVQLTNAGKYSVQISNAAGSLTTAPVDFVVPTLDQNEPRGDHYIDLNVNAPEVLDGIEIAQTFTPQISGRLAELSVYGYGSIGYPITVTIVDTINGQPGTNVLGRALIPSLDITNAAVFTNPLVYLSAGTSYAAVFSTDAPANNGAYTFDIGWYDSYPSGALWLVKSLTNAWQVAVDPSTPTAVDLVFATYMVPGIPPLRLTSPADGSQWQSADVIPLTAVFSPSNVTNAMVSFYTGTKLLGVISQPPYTLFWTNPPAGSQALSATVNLGTGQVTSAIVNISVVATQPPNDRFANRIALVGDYCQILVTNDYGTLEAGEPRPTPFSSGQSVWWTWTAPRTAWVTLDVSDQTATNAVLGVYLGSAVDGLLMVTNALGKLNFLATSNQTYQIVIDSLNGSLDGSELVLAVSDVELTAPVSGTVFTAPATINFTTIRTATDRTLDHVDFYLGSNLVGTATSPPYTLSAPCLIPGYYSLTAKALDLAGIATVSQSVPITVRPQNDNFANAILISSYGTNIQTFNSAGTVEPGEPHWADNQGGHSLWYRWTAPTSGICTIMGQGTGFFGLLLGVS